jgi:LysM repeat protein
MADRTVTVRLKVNDEFSGSVNAYTQKMGQAEQATQRMNTAAMQSRSAFSGMGTAIGGAIAAFGVMGVARLGEELYSTGMNAQRAGMLFASFGGQVGNTSALLERLRQTTRGVVDDTTLMSAASSQLSMGLARNADDVARLTNIGVTFASAMGQDVQSSMENLNMLLSNQSYLRLDTLGISSAQVRELAAGYRKAGMDSSEAFTAAFMDVAEAKLPQMDAVADSMVGPLQQMQTSLDNWWTDFGTRFAQGVNGLIGMVTHLGEVAGFVMAGLPGGGTSEIPLIDNGPSVGAVNGAMYRQFVQMQGRAGNSALFTPYQQSAYDLFGYSRAVAPNSRDALGGYGAYAGDMANAQQMNSMRSYGIAYAGMSEGGQFQEMQSARMRALWTRYASAQSEMQGLGGSSPLGMVATSADVDRAGQLLETIMQIRDTATAIGTEDQAAIWDRMYEAAAGMAEQVGVAADRLEGMNLSQVFGQTSGGRRGEMSGDVLSYLEGTGGDTMGFGQQSGLAFGMETGASLQYDQAVTIAGEIGRDLGSDQAIAFIDAYNAEVDRMATSGMAGQPVALDQLITGMGLTMTGGDLSGGGASYTVRPGDTASAIAAQYGVSVASLGLDNPSLIYPGQQIGIGGAGGGMQFGYDPSMIGNAGDVGAETDRQAQVAADSYQYHLEGAFTSAVDTFTSLLNNAAAHVVQVPIEFVLANGGALNTLLSGAIAAIVQGNGGTAPGASGNTGRSRNNTPVVNTAGAIGGGI